MSIPDKLNPFVESELDKDEEYIWYGKPNKYLENKIPIVVGFIGVCFLLVFLYLQSQKGDFVEYPFVVYIINATIILYPLYVWDVNSRTLYLITNKRVILREPRITNQVISIFPGNITKLVRDDGLVKYGSLEVHFGYRIDDEGDKIESYSVLRTIESPEVAEKYIRGLISNKNL